MASGKDKLRVMVDANILIAGIGWRRFPHEVMRHALMGDYQLVISTFVIEEAREHIARLGQEEPRERIRRIFAHKLPELDAFLVSSNFELIRNPTPEEVSENQYLVRDPEDIPIVLAAINANVDFLISQDKDITDPAQPVHQQLKIILPGTFLREHMGWSSEDLEKIRAAE